jgi:methionyl-tRNA synthetase
VIEYSDFAQLDMRVGLIVQCEKVPRSKNLFKLMINCGEKEKRQIITGISQFYSPEELVNKKVVVLINLKSKRIMGLESQGMLLAADLNNEPFLLKIDERNGKSIPPGSTIK